MSEISIRVDKLGKRYRITKRDRRADTLGKTLRDAFVSPFDYLRRSLQAPSEAETIWALRNVSFEVNRGEVLGILGHNGAGKSTLLSILSQITLPTEGQAQVYGKVGSLLQVGTGFHTELTGRENIHLNGTILGMKKSEVERKFDQIVDFSGVEQFIDTPIKRYSSGMIVRLGFSVAVFLDPEILLIDEVLSVGDADFRQKSLVKVNELIGEGRTVLFVSHDVNTVQRLCKRSILLESGQVVADTDTAEIIENYLPKIADTLAPGSWLDLDGHPRQGSGEAYFSKMRYSSQNPDLADQAYSDGPIAFTLEIQSDAPKVVQGITVNVFDNSGFRLINAGFLSEERSFSLRKGPNYVRVEIKNLHIKPGTYQLTLWLAGSAERMFDYVPSAAYINVVSDQGLDVENDNPYRDKVTSHVDVTVLDGEKIE
jgi:lipopolysaccharide transport system ATP-binding protein